MKVPITTKLFWDMCHTVNFTESHIIYVVSGLIEFASLHSVMMM
jgi:hypothetical protein